MKVFALDNTARTSDSTPKLKKLAMLGFLFFFAKGMIWLAVFAGAGYGLLR
ncbi:MAG: hypothetical protein KUG83_05430 [Gammaproteobacteria bacterium]|nr:hypothetical protein [Gammaproteobacteria bacterium]